MNTFAENPLFFLMDNMAPIISVKTSRDATRIIELSDTGCDAGLPVSNTSRNSGRYYYPKLSRITANEGCKSYYDERLERKPYEEKFRAQNEHNKMNTNECYFIPKKDEINQHRWQKHSPYEDAIDNIELRRRSELKNFRTKSGTSPERIRTNRWRQDNNSYAISPNNVRYDRNGAQRNIPDETNIPRNDHLFQSYPAGPRNNGPGSKFPRSNYPRPDPKINDQIISDGNKMVPMSRDYSEDFQSKETPRNSPRNYKDHWQRFNVPTCDDTENLIDEVSQKNHRYSRYNSRNRRIAGSAKSSDVSRDWNDAVAGRTRSRTCSPPTDRRKRTQFFPETLHENQRDTEVVEDSEFASSNVNSRFSREKSANSNYSVEESKRFVDRAVDKDSLSDVQNVCTSTEQFPDSTIAADTSTDRVEKYKVRTSFWEFIPLDDEDDKKCKKILGSKKIGHPYQQVSLGGNSYPLTKRLSKDSNVTSRTKRRPVQKGAETLESIVAENSVDLKSCDNTLPLAKPRNATEESNNGQNHFVNPFCKEQSNKPLVDEANLYYNPEKSRIPVSNVYRSCKIVEKSKNQEQWKYESKIQSKIPTKLTFGWTNRTNRYLKRPGSATKSESIDDKKKKMTNNSDISNITDDQKIKTNIAERAAACLKRKSDRLKMEEVSATLNQHSSLTTEKKIRSEESACSKLPIRIGNRLKSRNPTAWNRINVKMYASKEENKEVETKELPEYSCQLSSIRSRTKPKIKPSVVLNEVVHSSEASKNFQSMQTEQLAAEAKDRFEEDAKEKSKSIVDRIDDNLIDRVELRDDSSMLKFLKDGKLEVNRDGGVDELKILGVVEDQRKRNFMNRNCGRETNQRNGLTKEVVGGISANGFKEKCRFDLNDQQNIICNSYCNKEHRNLSSFRSRKPAVIKSQF